MGAGADCGGVQHRGKSSLGYFHHWKKKTNHQQQDILQNKLSL